MIRYTFKQEKDSKWYIDLPDWEGERWELEMVEGADILLEVLSQGSKTVKVDISIDPLENCDFILDYIRPESGGAWYKVRDNSESRGVIWLCHVTKFVFGNLPKKLYCNHVKEII